jgi:hypothetical protein
MRFPPPPALERGRAPTFVRWGDNVRLIRDPTEEVYYIDCSPGHRPADLKAALDHARMWGLDTFDPNDQRTTEILPDDTIRVWLYEVPPPTGGIHQVIRLQVCTSPLLPRIRPPATPRS